MSTLAYIQTPVRILANGAAFRAASATDNLLQLGWQCLPQAETSETGEGDN